MPEKKELTGFCLIILLALALRFAGISFDSLWLDESYQSLAGASGHGVPALVFDESKKFLFRFGTPAEPAEMLAKFRQVDPLCPPLYALLLNRWIVAVGDSDFVLRSLSAIISSCSVLLLMIFCRIWLGTRVALLAGLLNAVSPFDVHYAQEARMYSLVSFNALLSCGSLLLILRSELRTFWQRLLLPLYIVSTWALVNSHYTALFLAASEGFASVLFLAKMRNWKKLSALAIAWIATAAICIPWLPMFLQSASARKESFYVARTANLVWPLKALFINVPVNWLIFLSGQRVVAYAIGLYLSSTSMLVGSAYFACRKDNEKRIETISLWLWALIPALGLWLVDVVENHRVIEVARYVIYTAPAIYMLAAWGLARLSDRNKAFKIILFLHLIFAAVNLYYTHSVHQREAWRELAAKVEELLPEDEVIVVSQHYDLVCLDRYLSKPHLQQGLSPAMGKEIVGQRLSKFKSFALVTAQDGESIKDMLPPQFKLSRQEDFPHGLHLRLFQSQ